MLWLYRILFLPTLLVAAPSYLRRMARRGGYRENFAQRFGAGDPLPPKRPGVKRIWLQAVSVGEMLAVTKLIQEWAKDGDKEVYLTTTTSTGYRVAIDSLRGLTIGIGYFPIDWWPFSARAWRRVDPDLVILTEGERWPEHLHQAKRRGVPVLCINARLSDRSYARLRRFRFVARTLFDGITRLLPCSTQDAERFRALGVPDEAMTTTGNIKLDLTIPPLTDAERAALRRELGLGAGLVLFGASTWPGEEEVLLRAWREARAAGVDCSLLIVPRHAERRLELERWLRGAGVTYHFRSRGAASAEIEVAVGDTTGELRRLLQLGDVVFVGKSLPPNEGGQTPVEAAALGQPIVFGPAMSNFRVIADELVERRAAHEVQDADELVTALRVLLQDGPQRETFAAAARQWHRDNAGALARTQSVIREEFAKRSARETASA